MSNEAIMKDRLLKWIGTNHDTAFAKFWELKEFNLNENSITFLYTVKTDKEGMIKRQGSLVIAEDGDFVDYKVEDVKYYDLGLE